MKQINVTAQCDHGRKVHLHGFPRSRTGIAIVLQLGRNEKPRMRGALDGLPAYLSRAEARKLHRALTRILKTEKR